MSDFFQNGEIATFHKLKHRELGELEAELEQSSKHRPISLVLPYIPIELKGAGLPRIAEELSQVRYLKNVIVPVGKASLEDFKDAKRFFSALPQKPKLVWCTGPRIQAIYDLLSQNGIDVGDDGKGRSAWTAYGCILALENSEVIALHDCDIVT
jgi:glucosyl-3-phosphoglycerate synthase